MTENRQQRVNRGITVGLGTFIWVMVLSVLLKEKVGMGWYLVVAAWIGAGSAHLVENISDFSGAMSPKKLLLAALVSPAWPWLKKLPDKDPPTA